MKVKMHKKWKRPPERMFAVWNTTCGKWYVSHNLFEKEEDARESIGSMPGYYRGKGDNDGALAWEHGKHIIVPVDVPVPAEAKEIVR